MFVTHSKVLAMLVRSSERKSFELMSKEVRAKSFFKVHLKISRKNLDIFYAKKVLILFLDKNIPKKSGFFVWNKWKKIQKNDKKSISSFFGYFQMDAIDI